MSSECLHIWHAWVSCGRFIVRAADEAQAIALAREKAKEYDEDEMTSPAGALLLSTEGTPAVLDVDYS